MNLISTAKVLRVKNHHFSELAHANYFGNIENFLKDKGFVIVEQCSDGFFVTYGNTEFTKENKNTLIFLDDQGNLMDIKFTIVAPE